MRKLSMEELGRKTVDHFKAAEKSPIVVILDNVRSMHNVGSIFRTADAFLIQGLVLCGYTPTPPHRDINKTALGATETVDWKYIPDISVAIQELKKEGFEIWAVEQTSQSLPLADPAIPVKGKLALVFGNEVEGVQSAVLKDCDGAIEIPQWGMKHSLNISVAAGIVVWDLVRARSLRLKEEG